MSADAVETRNEAEAGGSKKVNWAGIGLFLILTFVLSWTVFIGLRALGVPLIYRASVGMFGPALAALLTRLIRREGFGDAGLRLVGRGRRGGWKMYLAAYFVPPLLIAASIGFVLLIGYQHWAFGDNLKQLGLAAADALHKQGKSLPSGMTPDQMAQVSLISQTVLAFSLALIFNSIFTFGEEFGWRGYLLPKLAPLGGPIAALITGAIWGFWHAPLIVLDNYNYPGHPWLGILMMIVFCMSLGVIQAWLRFRSGSVWPPVLAHAAINAQAGFAILTLSRSDSLLGAPIGLFGLVPMIVLAIVLIVSGQLRPDVAPANRKRDDPGTP